MARAQRVWAEVFGAGRQPRVRPAAVYVDHLVVDQPERNVTYFQQAPVCSIWLASRAVTTSGPTLEFEEA